MDPGTSHLEQLEAAGRQLVIFATEINHLYQAERARAAELERALERLTGSCSTTWARSASPRPCSTSPGRWTPTSGR